MIDLCLIFVNWFSLEGFLVGNSSVHLFFVSRAYVFFCIFLILDSVIISSICARWKLLCLLKIDSWSVSSFCILFLLLADILISLELPCLIVYYKCSGTLPREPMPSNVTVRLPTLEDLDAYALEQWEVILSDFSPMKSY